MGVSPVHRSTCTRVKNTYRIILIKNKIHVNRKFVYRKHLGKHFLQ